MKAYTYILIEFFTIIICFLFSFDKRIQFHKQFLSFIKASALVAIPFILWDIWFTANAIWWFNFDYTLNIKLIGLPIEEWLFFICIPFSCIFTFHVFNSYFKFERVKKFNGLFAYLTIAVCITVVLVYSDRTYTLVTALSAIASMSYLYFIAKVDWIAKASIVFTVLMLGFLPVNGILTGSFLESPIVNYNTSEIINFRILTIPIEDFVYGYTQFILIWYFFNLFKKNSSTNL